jgi:putative ABC transport system permease protein
MFLNYLKVSLRNILKHKLFSFINIFGLAAAMTVCMLILLMLSEQRSSDQFNQHKENIYRILSDKPDFRNPYATSPFPLSDVLKKGDPIVKDATHLVMGVGGDGQYNGKSVEMRGYFADPSFFKVFSFELKEGSKTNALAGPNEVVISSDLARQLFHDEDPVGKILTFTDRGLNYMGQAEASTPTPWGSFIVRGVLADKKYKSHLKFDVLMSSSSMLGLVARTKMADLTDNWNDIFRCYTYVMLDPGKNVHDLNASLIAVASTKYAGNQDYKGIKFFGQNLTQISPGILLGNEPSIVLPRIVYYILFFLALVVMISACLNYTNLSIARSLTRAKEIAVRKVNGATRKNIVFQFLSESIISALFALLMANVFLFVIKAAFLGLWVNQYLNFELKPNAQIFFVFTGFAVLIGLVAGIYPAFYLSKFEPIKALRHFQSLRPGKLGMRKVLSVTQFAISLLFIITSILIYDQSTHFLKFKYEFNASNIINVELQSNDYQKIARELATVPGVSKISACDYIPVTGRSEGASLKRRGTSEEYKNFTLLQTDENFVDNLELKLVAGRNLPGGKSSGRYALVNETAAREFGYKYPAEIIGKVLQNKYSDSAFFEVVGVVQDFHMSLDQPRIQPLVIQNQPALFKFVNIKIVSGELETTLARLEEKWKTIDPVHTMKYQFFENQLAATSRGFFDVVSILGFIAFIAVTIACLGMLGMATYSTERRIKEVGIRKAMGAEEFSIVLLLSKEFLRILIIAILIAAPLGYFLNNLWLHNFPNRVDFGWGTISLGVLLLLVLGLITIGSQTISASRRNPVDSLKME